jgi:hypothetical protein
LHQHQPGLLSFFTQAFGADHVRRHLNILGSRQAFAEVGPDEGVIDSVKAMMIYRDAGNSGMMLRGLRPPSAEQSWECAVHGIYLWIHQALCFRPWIRWDRTGFLKLSAKLLQKRRRGSPRSRRKREKS